MVLVAKTWAGFKDVPNEFRTAGGKAPSAAGTVRRSGEIVIMAEARVVRKSGKGMGKGCDMMICNAMTRS